MYLSDVVQRVENRGVCDRMVWSCRGCRILPREAGTALSGASVSGVPPASKSSTGGKSGEHVFGISITSVCRFLCASNALEHTLGEY